MEKSMSRSNLREGTRGPMQSQVSQGDFLSYKEENGRKNQKTKGEWISSVSVTVSMWLRYHQPPFYYFFQIRKTQCVEYMLRIHAKHDARIVIREIALLSFPLRLFFILFRHFYSLSTSAKKKKKKSHLYITCPCYLLSFLYQCKTGGAAS